MTETPGSVALRLDQRAFRRREAAREGFEYSDDLDVCCERFELIWADRER